MLHTPTSRKRTSRHSAPKSFMRFNANSRRFPEFSQPLVTRGSGMSLSPILDKVYQCRTKSASCVPLHPIHARPWRH